MQSGATPDRKRSFVRNCLVMRHAWLTFWRFASRRDKKPCLSLFGMIVAYPALKGCAFARLFIVEHLACHPKRGGHE